MSHDKSPFEPNQSLKVEDGVKKKKEDEIQRKLNELRPSRVTSSRSKGRGIISLSIHNE